MGHSATQNSLKNGLNIGNLARNFLKFSEKLQKYTRNIKVFIV